MVRKSDKRKLGKLMPSKFKPSKQYRVITLAAISSIAVGIVIILAGMFYYKYQISKLGLSETVIENQYDYHYAIISEEADSNFWDVLYQGALDQGKKQKVYVEKIGSNLTIKYSLQDLMKIAIASKVDGIILEPNGDADMNDLIGQADQAGIPVVTVVKDATGSKRISYVGINSYTQGKIYAEEIFQTVQEGVKNITVLLNEDVKDTSQMGIYSSILGAVANYNVAVKSIMVNTKDAFSSEESIRKIIMDKENPPDLLVCLTESDTRSAYQAVVDYNKVGEVGIVGYYNSEMILLAIEKNIVHSTMTLDAKQMGAYCVEALTEYLKTNNVSVYYSVDISVINRNNVKDYIKKITNSKTENDE